jgi:hypothetical protein
MESPSKLEDFDASKGVTFKGGFFDGQSIDELTIYNDGVKIDTRSSTEGGQKIIVDTLEWLGDAALITYKPDMLIRWAFLSQIVVHSDIDIGAIHPAYGLLSEQIGGYVNERTGEDFKYRVNGFSCNFQKINGNYSIAQFVFERRGTTPDSQNQYYSQAPLSTLQHLDVLETFENNIGS